jgi:hypothetical protein
MTGLTEQCVYDFLSSSTRIADLGGSVLAQYPYGVLLLQGNRPLGLWSVRDDRIVFRELANYEPTRAATDLATVGAQCIELLQQCQSGWAERYSLNRSVAQVA